MRTFLQLQTEVFQQLKEEADDSGFWSIAEVKSAINNAYLFIADEALCFRFERIVEIRQNIRKYKLPYYYIFGSLNRVEFDNKVIYPTTALELDKFYGRTWRANTSSIIGNYLQDICAGDEIAVFPLPDTDGAGYNLASDSEDYGVITTIGDDSYEEFETEEGVVVDSDGNVMFDEMEGSGPVIEIEDPTNNLKVFGARYPKRLFRDDEVCLHPVSHNPRTILTSGALASLYTKDGEGKDIAKASYHNKRFMEKIDMFKRPNIKRMHTLRSISDFTNSRNLNLGENYPRYYK